jgi:hypothetical protein
MTGLVRKAALLGACGLFIASVAGAAVPDPAHSAVPIGIISGGVKTVADWTPDPGIVTTVTVRDFLNNPIGGSTVELNYSLCTPDTKLCLAVVAGQTIDVASRTVRGATDAFGVFRATILGASNHTGGSTVATNPPGAGYCLKVYADGILLGTAASVILDLNGTIGYPANMGVNAADASYLWSDIGYSGLAGATFKGRSDFSSVAVGATPPSGAGVVNSADASYFYVHLGRSSSGQGSLGGCRGNLGPNPAGNQPYWP